MHASINSSTVRIPASVGKWRSSSQVNVISRFQKIVPTAVKCKLYKAFIVPYFIVIATYKFLYAMFLLIYFFIIFIFRKIGQNCWFLFFNNAIRIIGHLIML